jgi:hypothetical protein
LFFAAKFAEHHAEATAPQLDEEPAIGSDELPDGSSTPSL